MDKSKSDRSKLVKRILAGVVIALVLVYIVFLFITTNFLGSNNLVTETVYRSKAYDVIESKALAVRDEEYLTGSASGVLIYNVGDGDMVTADGVIATSYASEDDVNAIHQVEQLDVKIDFLESLNSATASANVGIDTVNSQIDERLISVLNMVNTGDFSHISAAEDNLLTSILRKQILTGEQGNIDEKIAELKTERDRVKASCGAPTGTVKSGSAGYFVSKVDGYEKTFDVSKLDEISAADVENAQPAEIDESAYTGKIIKNVNWYLLCPVSSTEAAWLSHAETSVKLKLPSALDEEIPAKILHVNTLGDSDTAVAVLQCNYMSDALSKLRRENVGIIVNEYEGLKVSKSALHDDDITYTVTDDNDNETEKTERVQGVYVVYGAELVFKQVSIAYAGDDFVIINEQPDKGVLLNGTTVSMYDKVVIEGGGDLFDGKIVQ